MGLLVEGERVPRRVQVDRWEARGRTSVSALSDEQGSAGDVPSEGITAIGLLILINLDFHSSPFPFVTTRPAMPNERSKWPRQIPPP